MFKMRKILAIVFLLFIILTSLMFSNFMDRFKEGMSSTVTVEDVFDKLKNNDEDDFVSTAKIIEYISELDDSIKDTVSEKLKDFENDSIALSDFKTILNEQPELVEFIKTKVDNFQFDEVDTNESPSSMNESPSSMNESPSSMNESPPTMDESPSPSTEPFQTRLTHVPYTNEPSRQISTSNESMRKQTRTNGVFNRVFEFSSRQPFQLKGP